MFIINVRFVCYLGFKCSNILGKEKLHFVHTIIEFFNVQAFLTLSPLTCKGYFQSPISNFESPLTKGRVKLTPKKQKFISQPSINHPCGA